MTIAKKPNTMKSYHSSALPTTAAAIWRGFGVDWLAGIAAKVMKAPPRNGWRHGITHRGHARRRDEQASEAHSGIEEFDRLPVLLRAREVAHEGHILNFGVRRGATLEKEDR